MPYLPARGSLEQQLRPRHQACTTHHPHGEQEALPIAGLLLASCSRRPRHSSYGGGCHLLTHGLDACWRGDGLQRHPSILHQQLLGAGRVPAHQRRQQRVRVLLLNTTTPTPVSQPASQHQPPPVCLPAPSPASASSSSCCCCPGRPHSRPVVVVAGRPRWLRSQRARSSR